MFQFATIVIVSISIGLIVCDVEDVEQFSGETGMMVGIEALYERFFHDSNGGCEGAPYLSNEFDMTGQTCVTNGQANFGRYYQRDPMEDNKFRRCDTDNSFCMTNENEVCRTSQIPFDQCVRVMTPEEDGNTFVWALYEAETYEAIRGPADDLRIAIEDSFESDDCSGMYTTRQEIPARGPESCKAAPSGNSYRAFHNFYNDTHVRLCDYAPKTVPDQSCNANPFVCHLYSHDVCAKKPAGGSFKVWTRDLPVPVASSDATRHVIVGLTAIVALLNVF